MEANVIYVTDETLAKDIATQLKNGASFGPAGKFLQSGRQHPCDFWQKYL